MSINSKQGFQRQRLKTQKVSVIYPSLHFLHIPAYRYLLIRPGPLQESVKHVKGYLRLSFIHWGVQIRSSRAACLIAGSSYDFGHLRREIVSGGKMLHRYFMIQLFQTRRFQVRLPNCRAYWCIGEKILRRLEVSQLDPHVYKAKDAHQRLTWPLHETRNSVGNIARSDPHRGRGGCSRLQVGQT